LRVALATTHVPLKDVAAWVYRGEIRIHSGQTKAGLADLKKATSMASASDPFVTRARKLLDRAGGRRARR
jgi:4-hydroxy-L-threonine phosphate dehydrogenase PdxA